MSAPRRSLPVAPAFLRQALFRAAGLSRHINKPPGWYFPTGRFARLLYGLLSIPAPLENGRFRFSPKASLYCVHASGLWDGRHPVYGDMERAGGRGSLSTVSAVCEGIRICCRAALPLQEQLALLSLRTGLFDCQCRCGNHDAVDLSGIDGAQLHTAHAADTPFRIRRKGLGIDSLHGAAPRAQAAGCAGFSRLGNETCTALFIGPIPG